MYRKSGLLFLLAFASATAVASAAPADPPALVGRVARSEGDVSFAMAQSDQFQPAYRQLPVTEGEGFWTDRDGRALLQVGPARISMGPQTALDIERLDYGVARLRLSRGSVDIRLWRLPEGGMVVITPKGEVSLLKAGVYRLTVSGGEDRDAPRMLEVAVLSGSALVPAPEEPLELRSGHQAFLDASDGMQLRRARPSDLDAWARQREIESRDTARADVDVDYTGIGDLDTYGRWQSDPDYDRVWYPSDVPFDWAPYRYGHWADIQPWGWTWIDDQPWGFAPFHYGRWVEIAGRWAWTPGRAPARPVYAPALVGFIGGETWGLSFQTGGRSAVGWVPLAPNEPYRPSYRVSDDYVRQLNGAVSGKDSRNWRWEGRDRPTGGGEYRNLRGATVVNSRAVSSSAPVQGAVIRVNPEDLRRAPSAPAMTPLVGRQPRDANPPMRDNGNRNPPYWRTQPQVLPQSSPQMSPTPPRPPAPSAPNYQPSQPPRTPWMNTPPVTVPRPTPATPPANPPGGSFGRNPQASPPSASPVQEHRPRPSQEAPTVSPPPPPRMAPPTLTAPTATPPSMPAPPPSRPPQAAPQAAPSTPRGLPPGYIPPTVFPTNSPFSQPAATTPPPTSTAAPSRPVRVEPVKPEGAKPEGPKQNPRRDTDTPRTQPQ